MTTTQTLTGTAAGEDIAAPSGVSATVFLADKITVTWSPVDGALSYTLYRGTTGNPSAASEFAASLYDTFYHDTTDNAGGWFYYWVTVTLPAGTSVKSGMATGSRLDLTPAAPTGVSATTTGTDDILISWSALSGAEAYQLWRAITNNSSAAGLIAIVNATSYHDLTAEVNTDYYYFVKGVNYGVGAGSFSGSARGFLVPPPPPPPPAAPTGVDATDGLADLVTVTWGAVNDATSYSVWRAATNDSGAASQLAAGLTATTYDDTTGAAGTTCYYFVKATNAYGTSGFSASAAGYSAAPTVPAVPDEVTATDGTAYADVEVTWAAAARATSYKVYRAATALGTKTELATGITDLSYTDTSLTDTSVYYYWVKAHNASGDSDYGPAFSAESGYAAVPANPTGVGASDGTVPNLIRVTWNAAAGAASYTIYRATSANGAQTGIASGLTGTSYDDESVANFGGYYYWVAAVNRVGETSPVGGDAGYAGAPGTPTITSISTTEVEGVDLAWSAADGAESYAVYRSLTDSFGAASLVADGLTQRTYVDTEAPFDVGLYYFVTAVGPLGAGQASASGYGYSPQTLPGVPTISFDAQYGGSGWALRWYATSLAVSYDVALGTTDDPANGYNSHLNASTTLESGRLQHVWDPTGLAAEGIYPQYYWVRAVNRAGVSAWSAAVGPYYLS